MANRIQNDRTKRRGFIQCWRGPFRLPRSGNPRRSRPSQDGPGSDCSHCHSQRRAMAQDSSSIQPFAYRGGALAIVTL